jgi:hypothetical protein
MIRCYNGIDPSLAIYNFDYFKATLEDCPFIPSVGLTVGQFNLALVEFKDGYYTAVLGSSNKPLQDINDAKEQIENNFIPELNWTWSRDGQS